MNRLYVVFTILLFAGVSVFGQRTTQPGVRISGTHTPGNVVVFGDSGRTLVDGGVGPTNVVYGVRSVINVLAHGAAGNGVADDTAGIQSALTAANTAGGGHVFVPAGTYNITDPLVIYDNTTLECSAGATIRLTGGVGKNLLINENAGVANMTGTYNSNIVVRGGVWDRGSNAAVGANNDRHNLFMRHVRSLRIENLKITSRADKYAIGIADIENYQVRNIEFDTVSDGVHIFGPATNGIVENITGLAGDDVVAAITSDYPHYIDGVHGSIYDLQIRNISCGSTAGRTILIMGSANYGEPDGHSLDEIYVEDVDGSGAASGISFYTRGVVRDNSTEYIGNLQLKNIRNGRIVLRHANHKRVFIEDCSQRTGDPYPLIAPGLMSAAPDGTNTWNYIEEMYVKNCDVPYHRLVEVAATNVVITNFVAEACNFKDMHVALLGGDETTLSFETVIWRDCRVSDSDELFSFDNTYIKTIQVENCNLMGGDDIFWCRSDARLDLLRFIDSSITSTGTTARVVYEDGNANCYAIEARGSVFNMPNSLIYNGVNDGTEKKITFSNSVYTNSNRFISVYEDVDFRYSNVYIDVSDYAVCVWQIGKTNYVSGHGWRGMTAMGVRNNYNITSVRAWDFPAEIGNVSPLAGDYLLNTDSGQGGGVGPNVYSGSAWSRLY